MNIYTRKRSFSGISIVPMLDILTILLIFFIVHTEFRHQTPVLKLDLPQTHTMAGKQADPQEVLLEVGADGTLALGGQPLAEHELRDAVRRLLREKPKTRVQVSAAGQSSMARFIEVMDELTAAGLEVEQVPVRIDYMP